MLFELEISQFIFQSEFDSRNAFKAKIVANKTVKIKSSKILLKKKLKYLIFNVKTI